ncbi:MAG: phosphatase PAP2 family protein [Balneolaceae bacterium]
MAKIKSSSNSSPPFFNLYLFDWLAIGFLIITACIAFLNVKSGFEYALAGTIHILISMLLVWAGKKQFKSRFWQMLRYCYPVIIIGFVHYEVEMFLHLFYGPGVNFDALVSRWDYNLFGSPHLYWHHAMPSLFWVEFFHFLYMTYYPILIGSIIWVWKNRPDDIHRFAFIYLGIFLNFVVIYLIFPVFGPLDYRATLFHNTGYLPAVVDFLFTIGAPDGAAFPSSHVGQSVGIYLLLRPVSKPVKYLILFCILGIGLSMIYVSIHYAIDAAAGLISGIVLYHIWNWIYRIASGFYSK